MIKPEAKYLLLSSILLSLALSACTKAQEGPDTTGKSDIISGKDLETQILTAEKSAVDEAEWGRFLKYSEGTTYGTQDSLAGVAEIKPGQEIHPPHVHAEEEYLMVIEGNGTWYLDGKEFPAKKGDMLYSRPWERHGIRNSGDKMLKFVVWKWNSKAVPIMPKPEGLEE